MAKKSPSPKLKKDSAVDLVISGYIKFLDKNGYPAITPPWGTLNAIDLNTGEYLWTVPYGEYPELQQGKRITQTGSESYGGTGYHCKWITFDFRNKGPIFQGI
jgi:quinoprotein glucose dehydrogenase